MGNSITYVRPGNVPRASGAGAWAFALFVVLNAVLFVRPAEVFAPLAALPIYQMLIITCLLASMSRVQQQLSIRVLRERPITGCVLGVLTAVLLSHLSHLRVGEALGGAAEFVKVVVYFLLLVAVVDSPARLRRFCLFLVAFIAAATSLALLQYHGLIDVASLEAIRQNDFDPSGEEVKSSFYRLCSTGIFNDPNDLSLILVVGIVMSFYFINDRRETPCRMKWIAVIGMFGYALLLTRSRGGLLAIFASLSVLSWRRFGLWKAVAAGLLAVPALTIFGGGRQSNIDLAEGTGQQRIQLWSDGLVLMKTSPMFGIGMNRFAEELGLVAHNSYVHCYTELGLLGGTMFVGAFYLALRSVYSSLEGNAGPGCAGTGHQSPEFQVPCLGPYVMAAVSGYCVGMLSLSRVYVVPTYLILGLAAAHVRTVSSNGRPPPTLSVRLLFSLAIVSMAFLVGTYLFVRVAVRRS